MAFSVETISLTLPALVGASQRSPSLARSMGPAHSLSKANNRALPQVLREERVWRVLGWWWGGGGTVSKGSLEEVGPGPMHSMVSGPSWTRLGGGLPPLSQLTSIPPTAQALPSLSY